MRKATSFVLILFLCSVWVAFSVGVVFASSDSDEWVQKYSGEKTNFSTRTFAQCWDGGFVIAGVTDFGPLLLKTDSQGNIEWEKTYEGTVNDYPDSLIETFDKGYALISRGPKLFKFDFNGNLEWNRNLVGGYRANSLIQTDDGGYVVAGFSGDPLKDEKDHFWLTKTDEQGQNVWNKTYHTIVTGTATAVMQTEDGGYAMVGVMLGDVGFVKTDSSGGLEWFKKYEKNDIGFGSQIFQTSDGGYMVAGTLWNRSLTGHGALIKIDSTGEMLWMKNFPGGYSIVADATSDGGYILCSELILTRTDSEGKILWSKDLHLPETSYASESSVVQTIDGGYAVLCGVWIIKTDDFGNIPEFPSWTILPLVLTATLFLIIVKRKSKF